jgi:hypothetical protein
LRPGDLVFDQAGCAQPVRSVQQYIPSACYQVSFDDGLGLEGDSHMALPLQDKTYRDNLSRWVKNRGKKYSKPLRSKIKLLSMDELVKKEPETWSIQVCEPLQYTWKDLPVPPYVMGIWLGSLRPSGRNMVGKMDLERVRKRCRGHGFFMKVKQFNVGRFKFEFRPSIKDTFLFAGADIPTTLPFSYVESSPEQREELLEGLIDACFYVVWDNHEKKYAIYEPHYPTVRRYQALVESLGCKTMLYTPEIGPNYRLTFRLEDKNGRLKRRYIQKIKKIDPKQCVHVIVDKPFLASEGFISVC